MTKFECPFCTKESSDRDFLAMHVNDWHYGKTLNDEQFDYLTEQRIPVELNGMSVAKKGDGIPLFNEAFSMPVEKKEEPQILDVIRKVKAKVEKKVTDQETREIWDEAVNHDTVFKAVKQLLKRSEEEGKGRPVTAREVRYHFLDKLGIPRESKEFSTNALMVALRHAGKLESTPMGKAEMKKWYPELKSTAKAKRFYLPGTMQPVAKEHEEQIPNADPIYCRTEFIVGATKINIDGHLAAHEFLHSLIMKHRDEITRLST